MRAIIGDLRIGRCARLGTKHHPNGGGPADTFHQKEISRNGPDAETVQVETAKATCPGWWLRSQPAEHLVRRGKL